MNRQQFLAELSQYLTFFSPEEKAKIISAYNEKFNSAGSENEAAVLAELGTPMMTAIDLKRRVEAGEQISFAPENNINQTESPSEEGSDAEELAPEPDEQSSDESSGEAHEAVIEETPSVESTEDVPEAVVEEDPSEESSEEAPEAVAEEAPPAESPIETTEAVIEEAPVTLSPEEIPEAPYEHPLAPPSPREENAEPEKPRRKVSAVKLIGASLLSIVITAFFLAVAAVGVVLLVAMSYLLLAGLKNLVYVTDCLLLFGGGLVCAGLGLLIVWFAVWSAGSMISSLFRNALGYGTDKECAA